MLEMNRNISLKIVETHRNASLQENIAPLLLDGIILPDEIKPDSAISLQTLPSDLNTKYEHIDTLILEKAEELNPWNIACRLGFILRKLSSVEILCLSGLTQDTRFIENLNISADVLRYMGYRKKGVRLVSCPTCARCHEPNMANFAEQLRKELSCLEKPLEVAIMGCEVNGPGEAKAADFGIAFAKTSARLFRKGSECKKVSKESAIRELLIIIMKDI